MVFASDAVASIKRALLWGLAAFAMGVAPAKIELGIDVLAGRNFDILAGQRVGLLTHRAGVNREGVPTWQVLHEAPAVNLVALFGPEHGIDGTAGAEAYVETRTHRPTGLPAFSLYGPTRSPTPEMLARIDTLVVDLQDIGTRSYTYVSALKLSLEACVSAGKRVVVLDRPNPLGGRKVDGPGLDAGLESYVGAYPVPYVHGLTIGELAHMARAEGWLDLTEAQRRQADLTIVPMRGWRRDMLWPDTGLGWVPTSPAIPDFAAAVGYPMTGPGCQLGGFRHGFGGPYPFRLLSHPRLTPEALASKLEALQIPGLRFRVVRLNEGDIERFTAGVYLLVTDWQALRPTELSFHLMRLAAELAERNPFLEASEGRALLFNKHTGSYALWEALTTWGATADVAAFVERWAREAQAFQERARQYWIYK
ncbi:MAG: DUF1343 domain-containing protein [Opitutales bacterium]